MTSPIPIDPTEVSVDSIDGAAGQDPSNTPIEQLLAPIDPADDIHDVLRGTDTAPPANGDQ